MIHPLFTTLARRPELVAEHLGAYAQLLGAETAETAALLRRRLRWQVLGGLSLALGLILGGTALLLWAALPLAAMPHPWVLAAVPAVPLALAAYSAWKLSTLPWSCSFALLRQQMAQDQALLREASDARA